MSPRMKSLSNDLIEVHAQSAGLDDEEVLWLMVLWVRAPVSVCMCVCVRVCAPVSAV